MFQSEKSFKLNFEEEGVSNFGLNLSFIFPQIFKIPATEILNRIRITKL